MKTINIKLIMKMLIMCAFGIAAGMLLTSCGTPAEEASSIPFDQNAYESTTFDPTREAESEASQSMVIPLKSVANGQDCQYMRLDLASFKETHQESDQEVVPYSISVESKEYNDVTWAYDWYADKNLELPLLDGNWSQFYDDNYDYYWSQTGLEIYDHSSKAKIYDVAFDTDDWYVMGPCAKLEEGILYSVYICNGYAQPNTCFMYAYDLVNDKLIWRSADQTYNSMNFIMKDDIILCGYGFTMENDYIYQLNKYTGEVVDAFSIVKMPNLLVEKDGKLYMHTYSYDYVLNIK